MDLSQNSAASVEHMLDYIKTKLRMVTGAAVKATSMSDEQYDDLRDIYELVHSKNQFSVSEIDAIVLELGRLRK